MKKNTRQNIISAIVAVVIVVILDAYFFNTDVLKNWLEWIKFVLYGQIGFGLIAFKLTKIIINHKQLNPRV